MTLNRVDQLAAEFTKLLEQEIEQPGDEKPLVDRQARRLAAYVIGNFMHIDDATTESRAARANEITLVAKAIERSSATELELGRELLAQLSLQLDHIHSQSNRTREDNT